MELNEVPTASLWTTACLGIATVYNYVETNGYTVTSIEKQKRQSLQGKDAVLIIVINLNKRCSHAEDVYKRQVEKVSINGGSDFEEGDIFSEEAAVVVTYHTFEDKD